MAAPFLEAASQLGRFYLLIHCATGKGVVKILEEKEKMINKQLIARGIRDEKVLEAFRRVPRHEFVRPQDRENAYDDGPLSIGQGQTISQPYIVALMTEALEIEAHDKVLEIGTGSGYQTAILAELAREVYSVERVNQLGEATREKMKDLGYDNIFIKISDGTMGWRENAPYDAIIVTAASPKVPSSLWEQLATGGRMIIPVGDLISQELLLLKKTEKGREKHKLGGCRFVPLLGKNGWKD